MNCLMSAVQCCFCKRTPKATGTDYYFDPKIMLLGTPNFEPHKLQNKVSEREFHEMRRAMKEAGGCWLSSAKFFFVFFFLYSQSCAIFGLGSGIYNIIASEDKKLNIPMIVNIVVMLVPNIVLQFLWILSTCKAVKILNAFFERQNHNVQSAKGVNWLMCGNLMYIRIKIVDSEMHAFGKSIGNGSQVGSGGKSVKDGKTANREILLKKYMT